MASTLDAVLGEAMAMSDRDRADLAAHLIASLDPDPDIDPDEVEAAWAVEIDDRLSRVDAGEPTIEWSVVRRQLLGDAAG